MARNESRFDLDSAESRGEQQPTSDTRSTIGSDSSDTDSLNGIGVEVISPDSVSESGDTTPTGRKRNKNFGVKRGPRGSRKQNSTENSDNLAAMLLGLHTMMALIASSPELELSEDEAIKLGKAIQHVNSLYEDAVIPEKPAAWIHLAMVTGGIWIPRVMAMRSRWQREEKENSQSSTEPQTMAEPSAIFPPVHRT